MSILDQFRNDANKQALKYVISKQMFCKYSGKALDVDNAIMIEADSEGRTETAVVHGSFKDKLGIIKQRLIGMGCTNINIFDNSKK